MAEYVPTFLGSVMKQIACTPNKNFDNDAYEKGVIEPAAKIRKLQEKLGDERPTDQQMREVMALLLIIFETKMVDMEEREDRVRETIERTQCHDVFPDLLPLKSDLESQIAQLGLEPGTDFLAEESAESEEATGSETGSPDRSDEAASSESAVDDATAAEEEASDKEALSREVAASDIEVETGEEGATDESSDDSAEIAEPQHASEPSDTTAEETEAEAATADVDTTEAAEAESERSAES